MHYGKYGLKEIITKKEMEYDFIWIRKYYYTDLLKLFFVKDIDDYEDYKLDLYFTLHTLNIIKETGETPKLKYLKNDLLKCTEENLDKNIAIAVDWYNKRVKNLFKGTEKDGCIEKIALENIDVEKLKEFILSYSNWLTKLLCSYSSHEVSFSKINRKINELLSWNEFYEIKKKRAQEDLENAFADLLSSSDDEDEEIYIGREKRYNLSCDCNIDEHISDLGRVFIDLFDKIYKEKLHQTDIEKLDIMEEMQEMFEFIKNLGHTNNRNKMTDGNIRDLFLTAGDYPENLIYMSQNEIYLYDKFCTFLLCYEKVNESIELIEKL